MLCAAKLPVGVRPFACAATSTSKLSVRCRAVLQLRAACSVSTAASSCQEEESCRTKLSKGLQWVDFALPVALATAFPAWAEDASDALSTSAATVQEQAGGSDLLVTIFFTGVVALLSIVTAGVLYLGILQALDKKQEMDDAANEKKLLKGGPGQKAVTEKEVEEIAASGKRAMTKVKRDKTKGFGSDNPFK